MAETKIVLSDIDGTFLTNDKKILTSTATAVHALIDHGIPFVLVSARMPEGIYPITQELDVKIPVISYSGALVLTKDGTELTSVTMPLSAAQRLVESIKRDFGHTTMNYYVGRHWYVDSKDKRVLHEEYETDATAEVADIAQLLAQGIAPNKIMLIGDPSDIKQAETDLGKAFPELNVVRSAPYLLEIIDKHVSKASGIKVLLSHYGIQPEEALSFGDSYNDLEMLTYTGNSVAMGNAPDEVKRAAKAVTTSNEQDGIYNYLKGHSII